jgi:hypothetical protein
LYVDRSANTALLLFLRFYARAIKKAKRPNGVFLTGQSFPFFILSKFLYALMHTSPKDKLFPKSNMKSWFKKRTAPSMLYQCML